MRTAKRSAMANDGVTATRTRTQNLQQRQGATSAQYDAMLSRLAAGGDLPTWEEVEKISKAEVAALEKRGVPQGNREAIRDLLNNAYAMRANAKDPKKLAEYREKYQAALDYKGEKNEGANKNKGLNWTVSADEMQQYRAALKKLDGKDVFTKQEKSEGATSREYDAMLARIAGGGELPKKEEVEKISKDEVAALEKRNVPQANREAIRDLLNSAYEMRVNEKDPKKFAESRDKYLAALNYRGDKNQGADKDKGLNWTVSPNELKSFRTTLQKLEQTQGSKIQSDKTNSDETLKKQVETQKRKSRTELPQSRRKPTVPTKTTKTTKSTKSNQTVRQNKGPTAEEKQKLLAQYDKDIEMAKWQLSRFDKGEYMDTEQNRKAKESWKKSLDSLVRRRAALVDAK